MWNWPVVYGNIKRFHLDVIQTQAITEWPTPRLIGGIYSPLVARNMWNWPVVYGNIKRLSS